MSAYGVGDPKRDKDDAPPPEEEECCSGQSNDIVRYCEVLCDETREYTVVNASVVLDCSSCWGNWLRGPCTYTGCYMCNAYLNDYADLIRSGTLFIDCPTYLCANVCS
jgi:cytochrome c